MLACRRYAWLACLILLAGLASPALALEHGDGTAAPLQEERLLRVEVSWMRQSSRHSRFEPGRAAQRGGRVDVCGGAARCCWRCSLLSALGPADRERFVGPRCPQHATTRSGLPQLTIRSAPAFYSRRQLPQGKRGDRPAKEARASPPSKKPAALLPLVCSRHLSPNTPFPTPQTPTGAPTRRVCGGSAV